MPPITPTAVLTATAVPGAPGASMLARLDPWMIMLIIVGTLAALMLSLWMVYSYINNIRTTEIQRTMLYESVLEGRLRRLREQAGLDWDYGTGWGEDPQALEEERQAMLDQQARLEELLAKTEPSDEERTELASLQADKRQIEAALRGRLSEKSIKSLRAKLEQQEQEHTRRETVIYEEAKRQAETLVPNTLTVAGMGITGAFFIELTAILTIIFGIIILGLVGVLTTTEIAPILASIAGYVLGKTTSGWSPYGGAAWRQAPVTPASPAAPTPAAGGGGD